MSCGPYQWKLSPPVLPSIPIQTERHSPASQYIMMAGQGHRVTCLHFNDRVLDNRRFCCHLLLIISFKFDLNFWTH